MARCVVCACSHKNKIESVKPKVILYLKNQQPKINCLLIIFLCAWCFAHRYVSVWYLQKPDEGIRLSETGVRNKQLYLPCGY